jgi:hypothetical protein
VDVIRLLTIVGHVGQQIHHRPEEVRRRHLLYGQQILLLKHAGVRKVVIGGKKLVMDRETVSPARGEQATVILAQLVMITVKQEKVTDMSVRQVLSGLQVGS